MKTEYGKWGDLIIEGLKEAIAFERGERPDVRVHRVEVTARSAHVELPPYYAPYHIRKIRHELSVSQTIFAEMLGVSASSARAWEQGKREPEGPARRLLQIAELHPDVLAGTCGEIYPGTRTGRPLSQSVEVPVRSSDPGRFAADTSSSRRRKP